MSASSYIASATILTSPSGSFSYPIYPARYPPATEVTWVIKVDKGKYINLTLHVIDVEEYRGKCIDIIEIKDGNNSQAPLLGGYCNSNKPTYNILSSSNVMRVWFQSANNSDGGFGFNISYTTVNDQACGGVLESFPGTITTPRYPRPYPNNRECSWQILAPQGMYIHVTFHGVYSLDYVCTNYDKCQCKDILDIQDGERALPYVPYEGYCTAKPWPFTSMTNNVSMKFVSGASGRFEGFSATYTTSLTKNCGADLWSDHGLITSPNYPNTYHSYRTCIWRITVPHDHYVIITFHTFDMKKSRHGFVGNVAIHDGYTKSSPLLAKLNHSSIVQTVNSTRNTVYIVFNSGYNIEARGFKATYSSCKRGTTKLEEVNVAKL